jgi:Holliday junction resolvase RusA-like endonuclease
MVYKIIPVAKPRMTRSDKWKQRPCVMRYRAYKDELRLSKVKLPECHHVTFTLPMPKSWSNKQKSKMVGRPHKVRPDLDNLLKGLWDALLIDDAHIWDCRATKQWGHEGSIHIEPL